MKKGTRGYFLCVSVVCVLLPSNQRHGRMREWNPWCSHGIQGERGSSAPIAFEFPQIGLRSKMQFDPSLPLFLSLKIQISLSLSLWFSGSWRQNTEFTKKSKLPICFLDSSDSNSNSNSWISSYSHRLHSSSRPPYFRVVLVFGGLLRYILGGGSTHVVFDLWHRGSKFKHCISCNGNFWHFTWSCSLETIETSKISSPITTLILWAGNAHQMHLVHFALSQCGFLSL